MPTKRCRGRSGAEKMEERIFGTNVLKITDYIYTNKMPYGIIRVTFEPYLFRYENKTFSFEFSLFGIVYSMKMRQ